MSDTTLPKAETPIYHIRLKGHLDPRRLSHLDDWSISHQPHGETLLSGPIRDQAALYGLLNRLRDLGVPLLSVMRTED